MPEIGEDDVDYAERIAADADVLKSAWTETIDDMKALAAEMEEEGWHAYYVAAGHTAPESPDAEPKGRWGLTHVIPNNYVEGFEAAYERAGGEFPEYDVYRQELDGRVFFLTVLLDPDSETAVLLAGQYELFNAAPLVGKAKDEGHVYTYVQTLDGDVKGSFRHEAPEKFFPHYEEFSSYVNPNPIGDPREE
jgi:hypothetical protein